MNPSTLAEYDQIMKESMQAIADGVDPIVVQTSVIMKLQALTLKRLDWVEHLVTSRTMAKVLEKAAKVARKPRK